MQNFQVVISKPCLHFFPGYFISHFYTITRNHSNAWKNGVFSIVFLMFILQIQSIVDENSMCLQQCLQFFKRKTRDESSESGEINNKASPTCDNLDRMFYC